MEHLIVLIIIIIFFIQLSYICRVSFNACYTDANFAILSVQQLKRNHPETYWSVYCVVGKPVRYALPLVICHMFPDFETLVLVLILIVSFDSLDSSSDSCFFYAFSIYVFSSTFKHEKKEIKIK